MPTRTLLTAIALATIVLTAPVNAKDRFDNRNAHSDNGTGRFVNRQALDVAAVPAYPTADQARTGRQPQAAGRGSLAGPRTAARAPEGRMAPTRPPNGFSTVQTAGGLTLTGEPAFVEKAASVIRDLAAAGYQPKRVTCLSYSKSHVRGSLHFRGRACDVDQRGWGRTPAPKTVLRMIVARHGLRDGCEFRDAGHFDDGPRLGFRRVLQNCGAAYAAIALPSYAGRDTIQITASMKHVRRQIKLVRR